MVRTGTCTGPIIVIVDEKFSRTRDQEGSYQSIYDVFGIVTIGYHAVWYGTGTLFLSFLVGMVLSAIVFSFFENIYLREVPVLTVPGTLPYSKGYYFFKLSRSSTF